MTEKQTKSRNAWARVFLVVGIAGLSLFVFGIGVFAGAMDKSLGESPTLLLNETISVSRSPDWKYGPGFYAAVVRVTKNESGQLDASCRVYVADANYFSDFRLGSAASFKAAYLKWRTMEWTEDELIVGSEDANTVRIKRTAIETHR
ncbi:MAG: hypothetical protein JXX14_05230 [Deltaproteobacteria bacterium]|nr:hypothetical protein [Deltaproteobacteria bacterium]